MKKRLNIKLNFKSLLRALLLSCTITILIIFITSLVIQFTSLRETKMSLINNITMVISVLIPSIYLSLKVKENGWINGFVLGFSYYLIIILLNIVLFKNDIWISFSIGKLLLTGFIGSIGGIIGINLL